MTYKVLWSKHAEFRLDEIYIYYGEKANVKVATTLVRGIIRKTLRLKKHPFIGQKEPLLSDIDIDYRYLISGNYKMIYSVDEANRAIKIATVFDVRQNPEKLRDEGV